MRGRRADPFLTARLRARVLDAWTASPARFREDANAEEDYALGGYRDRVVVELAQNAADAAVRGGVPGRLRLTLRDGTLFAANTGAPLDAAGVEALSTLRASRKRADGADAGTVGRFGVGFAAVVAVSDAPRIRSATGTVGWSRERTRELAQAVPELAGELGARSGHVPVLRLPFPADESGTESGTELGTEAAAGGYVTSVELPLRDAGAVELVGRLLAEAGPALLLALPALSQVIIEAYGVRRVLAAQWPCDSGEADGEVVITVDGAASRWLVATAGGELDPALLAGRPTEERARTTWSVRWAVPLCGPRDAPGGTGRAPGGTGGEPGRADGEPGRADGPGGDAAPAGRLPEEAGGVVHAPTPTDEPLGLPALLLASFPLGPDRRHVAPGPLTGFLIGRAAEAYAAMLPRLAPVPELLDLVPGPAGRGELDARLGRAIAALLPDVPFLPPAAPRSPRVRPRDALLLGTRAPGLAGYLAPALPGLVDGPARHAAYAILGVRRLPLAELADVLASLDREPSWWRGLYEVLSGVSPEESAELGALPVPLADGRLARGPRGVLLPGPGLGDPARLAVVGLRVVHADAAHPLLARLGATEATARGALANPATRAAVAASYDRAAEAYYDDDSPQRLADVVLGLVAAAGARPGDYPWLADLALPGDDGDWYPAGELLAGGSPLAEVVAADAPFGTIDPGFAAAHDARALAAVGVLSSFALLTAHEVELDEDTIDLALDAAPEWAASTRASLRHLADTAGGVPPVTTELVAVRDLDLVDPGRWPQALALLTRPPLRAALTEPTRLRLPDGRHADVPSYTAWWLRRHLTLNGRRPADLRTVGSDPLLAGLYDALGARDAATGDADGTDDSALALARVMSDPVIARALGVRTSLADLLAEPGGADELLARLADPARQVTRPQLRELWSALAAADGVTAGDVTPPERIRAVRGDAVLVANAGDVLVLDSPDLWPLLAGEPLVLAPYRLAPRLADLLDLPLASEEVPGVVESAGERQPVPAAAAAILPAAPAQYVAHDRLIVDSAGIPWRCRDGEVHAATMAGLACALAWATGHWHLRHQLTALLTAPEDAPRLLAEADLDSL